MFLLARYLALRAAPGGGRVLTCASQSPASSGRARLEIEQTHLCTMYYYYIIIFVFYTHIHIHSANCDCYCCMSVVCCTNIIYNMARDV